MKSINRFLLDHGLHIANNPCVSPDFCLDWDALAAKAIGRAAHLLTIYPHSRFETACGTWELFEDETGDCGWRLAPNQRNTSTDSSAGLRDGLKVDDHWIFPATFENLLALKNLVQAHDSSSTIFPLATAELGRRSLGIGARFTTLHWPAVDWAMGALGLGLTANQNSIPRELVYDVDAMLAGRLDTVPFPFIGTSVPEGHQGQSVEGMSHGCVLSKLKTGFHRRKIPWSFNADHQPIGGKFDLREAELVHGCILASYITFDLSPELALTHIPADARGWVSSHVPALLVEKVKTRIATAGLPLDETSFNRLLAYVWPAIEKMKRRDKAYTAAREKMFSTEIGRAYLRELSIDELPGLTAPETTAIMLALCEALEMPVNFVAPAFGFQKNSPYADNAALRVLIEKQWEVCRQFETSIGFHSGSGKSAENYRVMGEVTGGHLEIKTSGRYTYEMGRALSASADAGDRALWLDWHAFTLDLAVDGAFSEDETERKMARCFVTDSLMRSGLSPEPFSSASELRKALKALPPDPDHMFWFEYNFLYVLAAGGRAAKAALGDHSAEGYLQRARFYSISDEGRLLFSKNVAGYIVFLAENTGLAPAHRCAAARASLKNYTSLDMMLNDIPQPSGDDRDRG
ncbi:MAG TPA: tagaturonate epimerase family protein [Rariglobus sp.]|jgi:hypothetical protein|nr:tagaturonate epimerase family protein [Rariglobus sp.]